MLKVDKVELEKRFRTGDWNYVFEQAIKISDYVVSQSFSIYDQVLKEDMIQECMENLWKKIMAGKCDPNQNIFSFIWQNSEFRILEMLRKEKNRKGIATFVSYDSKDYEIYSEESHIGNRYAVSDEEG